MVLSPAEAARTFWAGCTAAFVVVSGDSGPVGCVHLSNFEPVNGCLELAVLGDPQFDGAGLVIEGAGLAIDYAFDAWPLRKIYFQVDGFNLGGFGTALSRFASLEAALPDRTYFQGRYWERRVYAVAV